MAEFTKGRVMFAVGDMVSWQSQSQGFHTIKHGEIVRVMDPGERPNKEAFPDFYAGRFGAPGYGRDHVSYIVRVGKKHYWPRVSALRNAAIAKARGS